MSEFVSEIGKYKIGDMVTNLHGLEGKLNKTTIDNWKCYEEETGKHAIWSGLATGGFEAWLWKFNITKAKQNEKKLAEIRKILE